MLTTAPEGGVFKILAFIDRAASGSALIGGWVTMLLMSLTCVDVGGRIFFSRPVPGAFETSEAFIIPALVYFSMAKGNHITVDWLVRRLRGKSRYSVEMIRHLLSVAFVAMVFWGSLDSAKMAFRQNYRSEGIVEFAIWPAYWIVSAGLGLLLLVRIGLLIKRIGGKS